jgi:hypothetical protein
MHCGCLSASMLRGFLLRFWLVFFAGFAWSHFSLVFDGGYQISCAFFLGFVVDFGRSPASVLFLIFNVCASSSLSILLVLLYRRCSIFLRIQNLTSCFGKPSYSVSPGAFEDVHGLSAACATPPTAYAGPPTPVIAEWRSPWNRCDSPSVVAVQLCRLCRICLLGIESILNLHSCFRLSALVCQNGVQRTSFLTFLSVILPCRGEGIRLAPTQGYEQTLIQN